MRVKGNSDTTSPFTPFATNPNEYAVCETSSSMIKIIEQTVMIFDKDD